MTQSSVPIKARERHALRARGIDPSMPLPTIVLVRPDGVIKHAPWAAHITNDIFEVRSNPRAERGYSVRITPRYEDEGWSLLEALYEAERWPEGWETYRAWKEAHETGARVQAFPASGLPAQVLRRRAGERPAGKVVEVKVPTRPGRLSAETKALIEAAEAKGGGKPKTDGADGPA